MALKPITAPPAGALPRLLRRLASRRLQRAVLALGAGLLLLALADGWRLIQRQRLNAQISALVAAEPTAAAAAAVSASASASAAASAVVGSVAAAAGPAAPTASAPQTTRAEAPELTFARAHALAAQGHPDAAISRYGLLPADTALGRAARFNSANLLLRQGMLLRESAQPGQALALIELAKEGYRELLRQDPAHWPARYNLDRAQRLVPDPDDNIDEPAAPPQAAERAATTMRGFSPGMP